MEDVIGRSFSYMILLFGFFLLVPLFLFLNMDMTSRNYVNTAVNEFVEQARADGVIRKSDYRILADELYISGLYANGSSVLAGRTENRFLQDAFAAVGKEYVQCSKIFQCGSHQTVMGISFSGDR